MKGTTVTTAIIAAIGARGADATLTAVIDFEAIKSQIGGTVNAVRLDKTTAVFYNRDLQTATLLDPYDLQGILALCGIDKSGNPVSLASVKQITKFGKVFKASRAVNTTEADQGKEV
jgi:hypothetical protein